MSRRAYAYGPPRRTALLWSLGTGDGRRFLPTAPTAETFHLLTEGGDELLTEASDFLDIEHV